MNSLRFIDSVTDFFRNPKWIPNLLLGGVCLLIPVVGPLVLMGWHATTFHGRGRRETGDVEYWRLPAAEWPAIDFARFVSYLQRGLWPFLVALVGGFALVPVMMLCMLPVFLVMATAHDGEPRESVMAAAFVVSGGMGFVAMLVGNMLLAPFVLRATVLQDFPAAFSIGWVRDYLARMWKEMLVALVFTTAVGLAFALAGYVLLCVGIYFTIAVSVFSATHLQRQLLDLYVQRGGTALTPAPTLIDLPLPAPGPPPQPPLPPA